MEWPLAPLTVTGFPNCPGLSPVNGALHVVSEAVITPATARSSRLDLAVGPANLWRDISRSPGRFRHESLTPVATETEVGERLHQRGWRTAFTVAERVNAWAALVTAIERGYGDDIYEYTNDLYCRNWLHEAWLLLDEHIVQLWTLQIKALDERYKAATFDDDGQALDQFHRLPGLDLWWWRRHPRILTGDLGRSLRSAGAIGAEVDTA